MDVNFSFLTTAHSVLLRAILTRRSPAFVHGMKAAGTVSRSDAERIMVVLSDELIDNLDDEWEPTEYGHVVSSLMAHFNAARIEMWPERK